MLKINQIVQIADDIYDSFDVDYLLTHKGKKLCVASMHEEHGMIYYELTEGEDTLMSNLMPDESFPFIDADLTVVPDD